MKRLVLILVLMLVPFVVIAGASNKVVKLHQAYFNGNYILDVATGTWWRNYAQVSQNYDGTYFVQVYRQCIENYGDCTDYDVYGCYTANAGEDVVLLANKNKLILDLQPEDCEFVYPYGAIPAQVVWQANGAFEYSSDYGNYHERQEGPDGQQCFSRSNNGSYESRSADAEGIFGDADDAGPGYIQFRTTDHFVSNCSH